MIFSSTNEPTNLLIDTCFSLLPSLPHSHILEVVKDFIRCGLTIAAKCLKPQILIEPKIQIWEKKEPITAGSALKEKKKETLSWVVTLHLVILSEKKIKKLYKMSELAYHFRLLTGEILPSGWAVCLHKIQVNQKKEK